MSLGLYDDALRDPGRSLSVRYADGGFEALELPRWRGDLSRADRSLLERCRGAVLDIGCGPGRLTSALAARGTHTLGIDLAPAAVALTRRGGAKALQRSVFDAIPDTGRWDTALLADGNIGIGGDPVRLLRRTAELVRAGGAILVELSGRRPSRGRVHARLEGRGGLTGAWFPWAEVGIHEVGDRATAARLRHAESWSVTDDDRRVRYFVCLEVPHDR
jgi:SAM-dependent methyltransferase